MPKKQKSGLYRAKIKIGVGEDGRAIYKYLSAKTKKELEIAKKEAREYYIDGVTNGADVLLNDFAVRWYHSIEGTLSASTRANYRTMLNRYIFPYFALRTLKAVAPSDLQTWLNQFAGRGKSTIASALTVIRAIFAAAAADRIIPDDTSRFLKPPKPGKPKKRRALTPEEEAAVKRVIRMHEHGLYLAVLYYLGLRAGEARGLMWGDFDWKTGTVHIQRDIDYKAHGEVGDLKTDAAYRNVPVPSELRAMLEPHIGAPDEFLFTGTRDGRPLSKSTAERMWLELMESAGLVEPIKKDWKQKDIRCRLKPTITPHYLRHHYITKCWEAGLDPLTTMLIVGHADYRTTANIYTHLDTSAVVLGKDALDKVL